MFLKTTPTVDSIISSFSKLVADLEKVEAVQAVEAAAQEQAAIYAQAAKEAAPEEIDRAKKIRNNILNLIQG